MAATAAPPPPFVPGTPALRASARGADEVPLAELAGTYVSADAETRYEVAEENGALVARGRYGPAMPLRRVSGDRFYLGETAIVFRRDAHDKVDGLSVSANRVWDMRFVRQP